MNAGERAHAVILRDDPYANFGAAMEFRLTYEGKLLSGQARKGPRELATATHKHDIRKAFHPQLKRFWSANAALRDWNIWKLDEHGNSVQMPLVDDYASNYQMGPYRFVPLVTERFGLLCSLHVLMLRAGEMGAAMERGDIDNRFKTILDALTKPTNMDQLGNHRTPDPGEDPFFVLLENDKYVDRLTVETDILLEPTGKAPIEQDSRLLITVSVKPYKPTMEGLMFV